MDTFKVPHKPQFNSIKKSDRTIAVAGAGDLSDGNNSDTQNKFIYGICMIVSYFPLLAHADFCGTCRDGEVSLEKGISSSYF